MERVSQTPLHHRKTVRRIYARRIYQQFPHMISYCEALCLFLFWFSHIYNFLIRFYSNIFINNFCLFSFFYPFSYSMHRHVIVPTNLYNLLSMYACV